jgi:hypothetical protein
VAGTLVGFALWLVGGALVVRCCHRKPR